MNPSGVITNWSHLYIAHRPLDGRCLPFVSFYVRGAENQQPHAAIFLRTKQAALKKRAAAREGKTGGGDFFTLGWPLQKF
jgi:hypothetical protein